MVPPVVLAGAQGSKVTQAPAAASPRSSSPRMPRRTKTTPSKEEPLQLSVAEQALVLELRMASQARSQSVETTQARGQVHGVGQAASHGGGGGGGIPSARASSLPT